MSAYVFCAGHLSGSWGIHYSTSGGWVVAPSTWFSAPPSGSVSHLLLPGSEWGWGSVVAVPAGDPCPVGVANYAVVLSHADYEAIRGGFTGFNLADVASILPAVALVWAVAWLFKRLLAVLRNQL